MSLSTDGLKQPPESPVVAVDVDEVLCRYSEGFVRWQLKDAGVGAGGAVPDVGVCFKTACCKTNGQAREDFAKSQAFLEIATVPGAPEALQLLNRHGVRVEAITSRPASMQEATEKYLAAAYPGLVARAHFAPSGQKGVVCRSIGASVLVDDQARNVKDACKQGVTAVLFDLHGTYSWSKAAKVPEKAVRLRDWEQVVEHLSKALGIDVRDDKQEETPSEQEPKRQRQVSKEGQPVLGETSLAERLQRAQLAAACASEQAAKAVLDASPAADLLREEAVPTQFCSTCDVDEASTILEVANLGSSCSDSVGMKGGFRLTVPSRIPMPPTSDPTPTNTADAAGGRAGDAVGVAADGNSPATPKDAKKVLLTPPTTPPARKGGPPPQKVGSMVGSMVAEFEGPVFEPLMTGYLLKKKSAALSWLARSVAGTPAQARCWERLFFAVGPGPVLRSWSSSDHQARGENPDTCHDLGALAANEPVVKGREMLLDAGRICLRTASGEEARMWAEACRVMADCSRPVADGLACDEAAEAAVIERRPSSAETLVKEALLGGVGRPV